MSPALNFWLVFFTNVGFATLMAWSIPHLLFKIARGVAYLENYQVGLLLLAGVSCTLGLAHFADLYNQLTGGITNDTLRNAAVAVFLIVLVWQGHLKWRLLQQLHPQRALDEANRKTAEYAAKMLLIDHRAPIARVEVRSGAISFANERAAVLFGYESPEQMLGKTLLGHVVEAQRSQVFERIVTRSIDRYECDIVARNGSKLHLEVTPSYLPTDPEVRICWLVDNTDHYGQVQLLAQQLRDHRVSTNYAEASGRIIARAQTPSPTEPAAA
jgi:PAS domain S-box-containing protein